MNIKRSIAKRLNKILGNNNNGSHTGSPIINLYKTNYDKKVLISYITAPFNTSNDFMHQNYITSHIIAECFSELGYNVDVVNYLDEKSVIPYQEYAAIFGFGYVLEKSFYIADRSIPRILFITGVHEELHNALNLQAVKDFYQLSELWLANEVDVLATNTYYSTFDSDLAIILAEGFIFDDYKKTFKNKLFSLHNNILGSFTSFKTKTAENRNNNFLFLSGYKILKKGLFVFLEVAKMRKDLNFYVVVPYLDPRFEEYYKEVLYNYPNVFFHKNIKMNSAEMQEIVESCSYCVAPSYADGFPGGTIEPMSAGLIPIVSRYCGFGAEEFIFEIEDLSPQGLNDTIDKALALDDQTFAAYSKAVKDYTLANFSVAGVKQELFDILRSEL